MTKGFLRWTGSAWIGRNSPPLTGAAFRDSLIAGTYKPNTSDVVGLIPDQPIVTQVFPTNQSTPIALSASSYENTIFWGQVTFGNAGGTDLSNCILAGFDPDVVTAAGSLTGNFKSFDSASVLRPHVTMYDCLISSGPWSVNALGRPLASGATRSPSPLSAGLHGGGFSLYRCEVTDVQDGVNYTAGHASSFCTIEASWIHKMYYQNGWTGPGSPAEQLTHSDVFQFNRGKTITIQHNMLGGARNITAYNTTPPGGYNGGDDSYSSIFQCKQEAGYTAYDQIHDVLINHNWIQGGDAGINMQYVTSRPNTWSDCTISNNIFSNVNPPETVIGGGPAYMIATLPEMSPVVSGNTIEETGATVSLVDGGSAVP